MRNRIQIEPFHRFTVVKRDPPDVKRHWIYFLEGVETKRVKIGYAQCPGQRTRSIQHQCTEILTIAAVIDLGQCSRKDAERREFELHDRFRHLHAFGEIFNPAPELSAFMRTLPETHSCDLCKSLDTSKLGSPWTRHRANAGKIWKDGKLVAPDVSAPEPEQTQPMSMAQLYRNAVRVITSESDLL